jgi:hypothetical protein
MNEDLSIAIQYFGQCKVLQEQINGTCNHVDTVLTRSAIGHTYSIARAYIDAREAYIDALSIFETMGWSKDHPEYANTWTDRLLCRGRLASEDIAHIFRGQRSVGKQGSRVGLTMK